MMTMIQRQKRTSLEKQRQNHHHHHHRSHRRSHHYYYIAGIIFLTLSDFLNNTYFETTSVSYIERITNFSPFQVTATPSTTNAKLTYAILIVRCTRSLSWIKDVPNEWKIIVYEKCGLNTTTHDNVTRVVSYSKNMKNVGAEECSSYLDYIYEFYDHLQDVTVFLQDDWNADEPKFKNNKFAGAHTPFQNFIDLASTTEDLMNENDNLRFVHYGTKELVQWFGESGYYGIAQQALWPFFVRDAEEGHRDGGDDYRNNNIIIPPEKIVFRPGATFAVKKDRILERPRDVYFHLRNFMLVDGSIHVDDEHNHEFQPRKMCMAMERMWHILFGEPPVIPSNSTVMHRFNPTT
jgi:hypothetical protein